MKPGRETIWEGDSLDFSGTWTLSLERDGPESLHSLHNIMVGAKGDVLC